MEVNIRIRELCFVDFQFARVNSVHIKNVTVFPLDSEPSPIAPPHPTAQGSARCTYMHDNLRPSQTSCGGHMSEMLLCLFTIPRVHTAGVFTGRK